MPGVLLAALGRPVIAAEIDAHLAMALFRAAVARHGGAARASATSISTRWSDSAADAVARAKGTLLIEGIGGVMVPLDDRHTVLDWMAALDLPGRCW